MIENKTKENNLILQKDKSPIELSFKSYDPYYSKVLLIYFLFKPKLLYIKFINFLFYKIFNKFSKLNPWHI